MHLFSKTTKELKRQMTTKADSKIITFKSFLIFLKSLRIKSACVEGRSEYWFCFGDDVFKIRDYINNILLKLYKRHPGLIKGMFNYVMHNYFHDNPEEKPNTLDYDGISIVGQIAIELKKFNILRRHEDPYEFENISEDEECERIISVPTRNRFEELSDEEEVLEDAPPVGAPMRFMTAKDRQEKEEQEKRKKEEERLRREQELLEESSEEEYSDEEDL